MRWSDYCSFCDKRTNWKIGRIFQAGGSREGRFRIKRDFDYCMNCGKNSKGVIER